MRRWQTDYTPPKEQSIGLGPDGFRTAQLKEYPREFSGALAQVIHDHLSGLSGNRVRECDPEAVNPEWIEWLHNAHKLLSEVQPEKAMCPNLQV